MEDVKSVPTFADDIRRIVRTGIPVFQPEEFDKLTSILLHGDLE
ncbi:hypothetical protein [Natronolimnobius sp. AArcel1]|nr:hypothetical protein [Natronolimnobius sp. AArcel1]